MKACIKLAGSAALFVFVSAYAKASSSVPEKYNLDGIYTFKDTAQMKEIESQLTGKNSGQ